MHRMPHDNKTDEETTLPRATVDKLISDIIKKLYVISRETKGILREACQVFLNVTIVGANKICEEDHKKIITNGHIYKALEKQGFGEFIDKCENAASDYDEYARHKPSKQDKFKESGKTLEELHEDQMRLFADAKREQDRIFGINDDSDAEAAD